MQTYNIAQTINDLVAEVIPQLQELVDCHEEISVKGTAESIVHLVAARLLEKLCSHRVPVRTCQHCGFTGESVIATRTIKNGLGWLDYHCIDSRKCQQRQEGK